MTRKVMSSDSNGIISQLVTANLNDTVVVVAIHSSKTAKHIRETVTTELYLKWSVRARRRSMDTSAKRNKDTLPVIHALMDWSIPNGQIRLGSPWSSAILLPTKVGWQIAPTRKSANARQPRRKKDGEWRFLDFRITYTMIKFPAHVIGENSEFRIHVKTFVINVASVWPMFIVRKKQLGFASDLFIMPDWSLHYIFNILSSHSESSVESCPAETSTESLTETKMSIQRWINPSWRCV